MRAQHSSGGGLRGVRLVVCLLVATVSARPAALHAQQDAFRDALVAFHSKLVGDYGDEGPTIAASLDHMASALAAWDVAIRNAEQELRPKLSSAGSSEAVRIRTTLAELYVARGRHVEAIRELDAAIQTDDHRQNLHVLRGLLLETIGRGGDAAAAFARAWEIDRDDPVSTYFLASRRAPASDPDEITPQATALLKALDRRLTSVPPDRHIPLFSDLVIVPDSAAVTPVFSPALYADGFALVERGQYASAIPAFRRALARDSLVAGASSRLHVLQPAIARLRDGDAENAIPLLEAAAKAAPRSSEAHRILAAAYADAGNDDKSIEHLETADSLAPDDERIGVTLGRTLAHAGRAEQAERVLLKTVAQLPRSTDAHSALADLYEMSGRGGDALHELEVATGFTVLAGKSALYFRLADLLHAHSEYEREIEPLVRRVRLDPNNARVHKDLGLAYTRIGRANDALVELVMASLLGPEDPETLTAIGQINFDAGNYTVAESVLRRAIADGPTRIQTWYVLGQTLARLGRESDSREQLAEFDRLRAADHERARREFELNLLRQDAVRATNADRHEDAMAIWQQIVDREPDSPANRKALAGALRRAGHPESAIGQLETASALDNSDREVYGQLAEIYALLGRTGESAAARQTYQRLLREERRGR